MGFDGFVISDWDGIAEVPGCSNDSCPQAINAGIDMVMVPDNWKNFIANTIAQVERGEISMARVDDAVTRILRVKMRAGLFGKKPSENPYAGKQDALVAHDIARQAVRESLVLLKNDKQVLPLTRGKHILVVGKSADNMSNQSGGWSITWQGTENKQSDYVGDTLLAGFKEAAGDVNVHYSATAEGVDVAQFDAVIAVIGETAYAEGFGDIASSDTLRHSQRYAEDLAVLQKVAGKGKPVVTVLLSGRAVYANDLINLSDSFVAAWLPGTEGKGVADVLFKNAKGKINHPFTGSLSFSWPNVACLSGPISEAPVNSNERLFGLGYGLRYGKSGQAFPRLSEDQTTQCAKSNNMAVSTASDSTHFPVSLASATRKVSVGGDISAQAMGGTISLVNKKLGSDAAHLVTWSGAGRYEASAPFATVLPANIAADGALQFTTQVMQAPQAKVSLTMECGEKCLPAVDLTAVMTRLAGAAASTVKIPLACFIEKGLNPRTLKTPFSISTTAGFAAAFSNIQIVAGAGKDADALACSDLK
jgi:beta-glucosidase